MSFKIDELFYELDARTAGFENNISHAQTSVDNFAKFIRQKPMLATAAFAASILAIGIAAIRMADEVDISLRKVEAAFPGATKQIDLLRQSIEDISELTPRTQSELAAAAAHIAERGVESVAEIQQRLKVAVDLADATGSDLITVIEGLDNVGDAFGLSATQAADALTRIYGAAQGKVALSEVISTLERGGSVLHSFGVEAADAGEAMVALIDAGVPRRQAGTVLTTILELTGRVRQLKAAGGEQAEVGKLIEATLNRQNIAAKGLAGALADFATQAQKSGRDLTEYGLRGNTVNAIQRVAAAAARDTRTETEKLTDAQNKLQAAAATNRESASALAKIFRNELSESLLHLGNELLPYAIKMVDGLTAAMRRLHGEGNPLRDLQTLQGKLPTTAPLPQRGLSGDAFRRGTRFETQAEKDAATFYDALQNMSKRVEKYGTDALSGVNIEDLKKIAANLQDLYAKGAPGKFTHDIQELGLAISLAINEAKKAQEGGAGTPAPNGPPAVPALTNEVKQAIESLRRSVASAVASQTETQIDDARERVKAFREEVEQLEAKAGRKLPDLEGETKRLDQNVLAQEGKERAAAAKSVADEVAQALGLQSRIMEQGLADFLAEVEKRNAEYAKLGLAPLFSQEQVDRVREIRQALIDATKAAEEADAAITASRALSQPVGGGQPNLIGAARRINDSIAAISTERDATSADTPAGMEKRKRLQAEINKLQAELNSLRGQNDQLLDKETQKLQQHTKMLQDQANALNTAVGYVLQLGQAFGIVDQKTASILQSVVGAAAGIGPFLDQLKNFRSGAKDAQGNPLATIGSLIGAASPIIGGIAAIGGLLGIGGGKSPEEIERNRLMKENNARLAELNDSVGDLARINVTGTEYGKYSKLLSDPRLSRIGPQFGQFTPDQINRAIGSVLDAANITSKQLIDFAASFGVTVGTGSGGKITLQDIDNLRKAMQASELTQFADTFTGQMQEMDAAIHLFDLTDPIKQLEQFRKAIDGIKGGGGILQRTIDAFDTSTAEGLAAAQEAIQKLFEQLQAGTLRPEDLGGLTAQEFLDALLKESDLLKAAAAGSGPLGTGGFNVSQQITEVTGARLAAIADSSRVFLEQIAGNTAEIARMLGGNPTLPALVPPAPNGSGAGASGGDTYNITVNFDGPVYADEAEAIGERIGGGIIKRVNQGLGREAKLRAFTAGKTLTVGR
jgi:hypothetical protein